jgi:hypothetical protein
MKMVNGKLPTWYVMKRLGGDGELYAEAPETSIFYKSRAQPSRGDVYFIHHKHGKWEPWDGCWSRDDWTLYRHGKKSRKQSDGEVKLGRVESDSVCTNGLAAVTQSAHSLRGTYDIIAVPVGSKGKVL